MSTTRTFTVTITHSGDTPEAFDKLFTDYLTQGDAPFQDDYGPGDQDEGRHDGYEGPYVLAVTVAPVVPCIVVPGKDGPTLWDCECDECKRLQRGAP